VVKGKKPEVTDAEYWEGPDDQELTRIALVVENLYSTEAQAGSAFKIKTTGVEHNFKSCVGGLDVLFLKE
jgi:hypothetical protein